MKKIGQECHEVFLSKAYLNVSNVLELPRVGAGHDGIVYKYGDLVLKILKYDIKKRKEKDLMTFEKVTYFVNELKLKRVAQPIDILLNSDGIYTGYVMKYFEDVTKDKTSSTYKESHDFTMKDLYKSIHELEEDFNELTAKRIVVEDLNRGSYIITSDYLTMCDMDKYKIMTSGKAPSDLNKNSLNFFLSKWLFFEMEKGGNFTKEELKQLIRWVKKSSNSRTFLRELQRDCLSDENYPIGEYTKEKAKVLLLK